MPLLYHAYVYLEFLILACTIYILAPSFLPQGLIQSVPFYVSDVHRTTLHPIYTGMLPQNRRHIRPDLHPFSFGVITSLNHHTST